MLVAAPVRKLGAVQAVAARPEGARQVGIRRRPLLSSSVRSAPTSGTLPASSGLPASGPSAPAE
eukprot:9404824-Alexandrium_andersonii.AAC.1